MIGIIYAPVLDKLFVGDVPKSNIYSYRVIPEEASSTESKCKIIKQSSCRQ